ncbi:hypothetical protein HUE56_25455 (plasmid) [Azospirillum oryzae]|uniref:MORN repeat-containing protein n=1 Tax=Azospirillum oryzae TaxID=286727 RepID=A0A6N1AQG2_9PROT|nr:hypothetical protein [Azospirillum oryzae]KAA0587753.1 hypothetical protein FZ938_16220 [Azospirillum oryzae]QKS53866.1 hypothetical protein HUE56_25455 [Azospirillum oryzae]GLR77636.1 hypothetical protein GCM10007856_03040 [Azospirillum oryzae]
MPAHAALLPPCLAAVLSAMLPASALAERAVTVQGADCQVWDQYPDRRKTIRWSGACPNGWGNGPGVLSWSYDGRYDGQVEGTLIEGRLEGQARVTWRDGRRLDGSFRDGLVSGQATHVWPDGRVYEGEWKDDRRTGFGTLAFPSGNKYVGRFHRNRPTGPGEFVAADGHRYRARIDAGGKVSAGAPLDRPPQSAEVPSAPEPKRASPPVPANRPQKLEEWLNQPDQILRDSSR